MLLHALPLNARRESEGKLPINSVWISDIGRSDGATPALRINSSLSRPWQEGDLAAWCEAWRRIDADTPARPYSPPLPMASQRASRWPARAGLSAASSPAAWPAAAPATELQHAAGHAPVLESL